MLSGTGYPSGSIVSADTSMANLHVDIGNLTGKISPSEYRYGMALTIGYVPIASIGGYKWVFPVVMQGRPGGNDCLC